MTQREAAETAQKGRTVHMSGRGLRAALQGSSVGHSFEQLRFMVDAVHDRSRVGVCLDTCHMFAAGYDISTDAGYISVMEQFGEVVGWSYLKGESCLPVLEQYAHRA